MTSFWTRGELKDRAKTWLRACYWQAFLVCLIAAFLGAGTQSLNIGARRNARSGETHFSMPSSSGISFSYDRDEERVRIQTPVYMTSFSAARFLGSVALMIMVTIIIGIAVLAFNLLVSNVIQVGKKRYFLGRAAGNQETDVGKLFSGFGEGYGNLVWVMILRDLNILLWMLLLIIPGIVKAYEYYMVPYLLAENPYLSWEEARDRSSRMMEGNKFKVFVLELSFIGWDFLGALLCGVGQVFVSPYKEAVYAELYRRLNGYAGGYGQGPVFQEGYFR